MAGIAGGGVDDGAHLAVGDDRHGRHAAQRLHDGQLPEVGGDDRVAHVVGDQEGLPQRHDLPADALARTEPDLAQHGLVPAAGHAVHGEHSRPLADGDAGERQPHRRMERPGRLVGQGHRVDDVEDDLVAHGLEPAARLPNHGPTKRRSHGRQRCLPLPPVPVSPQGTRLKA